MSQADIYFVLFRRKWLILAFSVLGIAGAAVLLFVIKPPQYQSQALISIRYVVEAKSLNPPGDQSNTRPLDEQTASIINTEIAMLHSFDLAKNVVQAMTPERILAGVGGGADVNRAAAIVNNGISVDPIPESSVISITYENPDPMVVRPILSEFIDAYSAKHVQMHEGVGVPNNFLTNETIRLRAELAKTDDELRKIKSAAGVISVDDAQKGYAEQISTIHQNLFNAEAELSERQAMLAELGYQTDTTGTRLEATNVLPATNVLSSTVAPELISKYKSICSLLNYLEAQEQNYLTQQGFTTSNVLVKPVLEQIIQNEAIKKNLEAQYPGLVTLNIPPANSAGGQPAGSAINLKAESEEVAALQAKIRVLNSQLSEVWSEVTNFDKVKTSLAELEQKRKIEETNLNYLMGHLEDARIDESLGADKAANISIIQAPSPPAKGWSKSFKKKVAMVAAGGIFGGLALAFLIELFLDRSIKRPTDIETKLRLPLFITIPAIVQNGHRHSVAAVNPLRLENSTGSEGASSGKVGSSQISGVDLENRQHPFRRFSEGLRDRLIVYFETRNLTQKPKLVAVTSCGKGAGVSTIAASVAASLSETGDGNVLLVNISGEQGAAQQFYKGKPGYSLDEALATKGLASDKPQGALVKANLYTTVEQAGGDMLPANLPKKIAALMPRLKASEYDYIIFDLPPVSQTSVTARLSGLMDMVLLVIEAEKTNQDVVKRVNQLLAESKATVGTVLNKTQTYVPRCLHQEFLHDI